MIHTTTYRQKDNGWQIIVRWKDANGKWRQKSKQGFMKKADAKAYESQLLKEIKKRPRPVDKALADITLKEFCKHYISVKRSITNGTKAQYVTAVKSLKELANKSVCKITYLDLQTSVNAWNLKPQTQNNI